MNLSQKQNKSEYLETEQIFENVKFYGSIILSIMLFIWANILFNFNYKNHIIQITIIAVLFLINFLYALLICFNFKLNKAINDFKKAPFTDFKQLKVKNYEEFEQYLIRKFKNKISKKYPTIFYEKTSFTFLNTLVFRKYLKAVIENYLKSIKEQNPQDDLIQKLIKYGYHYTNIAKSDFINKRVNVLYNHIFENQPYISVDDVLENIKSYTECLHYTPSTVNNIFFKQRTLKTIKKEIRQEIDNKHTIPIGVIIFLIFIFNMNILFYLHYIREDWSIIERIITTLCFDAIIFFVMCLIYICIGWKVIEPLLKIFKNIKNNYLTFKVAKYLPVSAEEIESLKITSIEEMEALIIDLADDELIGIEYSGTAFDKSYKLKDLIFKSLKTYIINSIETDKSSKALFENSFNNVRDVFNSVNAINEFCTIRTTEIYDFITGNKECIEKTDKVLNSIIRESQEKRNSEIDKTFITNKTLYELYYDACHNN